MIDARVPLWFYGTTSIIYLLSSIICFLVAFFAYKTYKMDQKKKIILLLIGFLLLGLGFIMLALPSLYIYFGLGGNLKTPISINYVSYIGFTAYYVLSIIAYVLFLIMYFPRNFKSKNFIIFVPLWYADLEKFHILSIILLLAILLQTIINSIKKRNLNSYLVTLSFLSLTLFHLLMMLTTFSVTNFIIANSILILGFLSLLFMLIRVKYGGKQKV